MTWAQLLYILQGMETAKHISMEKSVEFIIDGNTYNVDIIESLYTGEAKLIAAFNEEEDDDDAE